MILYNQLRLPDFVTILPWVTPESKALYLFNRWDSNYYYSIAVAWYPHHLSAEWAFPLYPAMIRVVAMLGIEVTYAALIITTFSGLISVLVFQRIAGRYLGRVQGATTTLLYFTLPPVFVFSAVSYSEPVFLLFSLLAWYLHVNRRDMLAGSAAAISSMARPYGVLMALPLFLDYVRRQNSANFHTELFP